MKKVMVCSKLRGYVMFAFSLVNTCKRFLRHGLRAQLISLSSVLIGEVRWMIWLWYKLFPFSSKQAVAKAAEFIKLTWANTVHCEDGSK